MFEGLYPRLVEWASREFNLLIAALTSVLSAPDDASGGVHDSETSVGFGLGPYSLEVLGDFSNVLSVWRWDPAVLLLDEPISGDGGSDDSDIPSHLRLSSKKISLRMLAHLS